MATIEIEYDEHIALVSLNSGDNRFNPDFLNDFLSALDDIEENSDSRTLVVTSSHEKIFSNGIDLEWLLPVLERNDIEAAKGFFYLLNRLLKRLVTYPMVTIAAVNGHAFAGGAIMSCAFDFRFMRTARGFFCLPEVDLGIPFLPGMNALLKKAIPMQALELMQYTGRRFTAEECQAQGIIATACPVEELMDKTLAFARPLQKDRRVIGELKRRLTEDIVRAIDVEDKPYIESGKYRINMAE